MGVVFLSASDDILPVGGLCSCSEAISPLSSFILALMTYGRPLIFIAIYMACKPD